MTQNHKRDNENRLYWTILRTITGNSWVKVSFKLGLERKTKRDRPLTIEKEGGFIEEKT